MAKYSFSYPDVLFYYYEDTVFSDICLLEYKNCLYVKTCGLLELLLGIVVTAKLLLHHYD